MANPKDTLDKTQAQLVPGRAIGGSGEPGRDHWARENRCTTLIASQLEPNEWLLRIEGELIADSILNRIATDARYINLEDSNMRDYFAKKKPVE